MRCNPHFEDKSLPISREESIHAKNEIDNSFLDKNNFSLSKRFLNLLNSKVQASIMYLAYTWNNLAGYFIDFFYNNTYQT